MMERKEYPERAGWKGNKATGIKGAFYVSRDLGRRHTEVLSAFETHGVSGTTCDVIGETIGLPTYLVRPRASELEEMRKLFAIGETMGRMGRPVTIYSTQKPDQAALDA